jgi:hypothetical protein
MSVRNYLSDRTKRAKQTIKNTDQKIKNTANTINTKYQKHKPQIEEATTRIQRAGNHMMGTTYDHAQPLNNPTHNSYWNLNGLGGTTQKRNKPKKRCKKRCRKKTNNTQNNNHTPTLNDPNDNPFWSF